MPCAGAGFPKGAKAARRTGVLPENPPLPAPEAGHRAPAAIPAVGGAGGELGK